jgi:hypothetical protein
MALRWTATGAVGDSGTATRYDLRVSPVPPGSDLDAWWAAAVSQPDAPDPLAAGSLQSWESSGNDPSVTLYAAIRAANASEAWSPLSPVAVFAPSAAPFLQDAAPTRLEPGSRMVVAGGLGLGQATAARLIPAEGGDPLPAEAVLSSEASATLGFSIPAGPAAVYDLEIDTPHGTDRLRGWILAGETGTVDLPPDRIVDLTAEVLSTTSLRLRWTAPADPGPGDPGPAASYDVRRLAGSPGAWTWEGGTGIPAPLPGTPGSQESLVVDGLVPGSTVAFGVVSGDDAGGASGPSNFAQATLPEPPPGPSPVTNLTAAVVGSTTVVLRWSAPESATGAGTPVSGYDVRRLGGSPGAWSWETGISLAPPQPVLPGGLQTLTVDGLPAGSVQAFAVASRNEEGVWSDPSNTAVADLEDLPDRAAPETVGDLTATVDSGDHVVFTWTEPADDTGVFAYEFRRTEGDAAAFSWPMAEVLADPPVPGEPHTPRIWTSPERVGRGESAAFAMVAQDVWGNTAAVSNVAAVDRTREDAVPPDLPDELTASRFRAGYVQLRWRAGGDDGMDGLASGYELRRRVDPDPAAAWWEAVSGDTLDMTPRPPGKREFHNVSGLAPGFVHGFALRVIDESGLASPWRAAYVHVDDSGSPDPATSPPSAPSGLTVEATPSGVLVSWDPSPDPDLASYRVQRMAPGEDSEIAAAVPAGAVSFVDPWPVADGTRYSVLAVNVAGVTSAVAPWVGPVSAAAARARAVPKGGGWELTVPAAPEAGVVLDLEIFDVRGRRVARAAARVAGPVWLADWDGRSLSGRRVPSGVYFVRPRTAARVPAHKILLAH